MTGMAVAVGKLCPLQSSVHFGLAQTEVESTHPFSLFKAVGWDTD